MPTTNDEELETTRAVIKQLQCQGLPVSDNVINMGPHRKAIEFQGVLTGQVSLYFFNMCLKIDRIQVAGGHRDKGLCRGFIQTIHDIGAENGFKSIEIYASGDLAFVWALLGFQPKDDFWQTARKPVANAFRHHRECLPEALAGFLEDLLRREDPSFYPVLGTIISANRDLPPAKAAIKILLAQRSWAGEIKIGNRESLRYLFPDHRP